MWPMYRTMLPRVDGNQLIVEGVHVISKTPDMAVVTANVSSTNANPMQAEIDNVSLVESLKKDLKNFGVRPEDVEIAKKCLKSNSDGDSNTNDYIATTQFKVNLYDTSLLRELLFDAKNMGAVIVRVVFTLKDPYEAYDEALIKAIDNGLEKAKKIANHLQIKVQDRPHIIIEMTDINDTLDELAKTAIKSDDAYVLSFVRIMAIVKEKFYVEP